MNLPKGPKYPSRSLFAQPLIPRHNQQIEEVNVQHQEEHERLQEQLRRERARCQDDR